MREHYTDYPRPILWLIPGGTSTVGGDGPGEMPPRAVEVAPFYLSKLPVSNEQFEAFDPGFERSPESSGDDDPATGVSWHDAAEYCAWYAEVSRKPMRLPSEEEWEHACRGGGAGRWPWGDDDAEGDDFLWDAETSGGRLPPLEAKKANGFGLFGMLGGVWEWTGSLLAPAGAGPGAGPGGREPAAGGEAPRVLRGGCFRTPRAEISCARRRGEPPGARFADAGFRLARSFR
ncbi:MAG TPA: SUMF1/EgtB/PvdO family nonheme iron enzyme [Thermoanaerobaculia bacterium]|nr:SUMF1/EgtB/PvdO family nonheme iron enzyme [Thermoanaerobaculia bacterium]